METTQMPLGGPHFALIMFESLRGCIAVFAQKNVTVWIKSGDLCEATHFSTYRALYTGDPSGGFLRSQTSYGRERKREMIICRSIFHLFTFRIIANFGYLEYPCLFSYPKSNLHRKYSQTWVTVPVSNDPVWCDHNLKVPPKPFFYIFDLYEVTTLFMWPF